MARANDCARYYMQIQPDWHEIEGDKESCWLDVYERTVMAVKEEMDETASRLNTQILANNSSHLQLPMSASTATSKKIADSSQTCMWPDLVKITKQEKHWIEVQAMVGGATTVRTVFQAPVAVMNLFPTAAHNATGQPAMDTTNFKDIKTHQKLQLYSVDISIDEQKGVVGGSEGFCALWNTLKPCDQVVPLVGHVLDVSTVKFFPSSKVVLTGSLDFTLRIWSVENGLCAAVLKGHRGGVQDAAIIGKGRNVLSCASDGLIHLWCCGNQQVMAKWGNDDQSPVHCLSLLDDSTGYYTSSPGREEALPAPHQNEAETAGKVLFAGLENGETLGVDIRARSAVANLPGTAAILSCMASSGEAAPMLFTGSEDGILAKWDLRYTRTPMHLVSRSSAAIHQLALSGDTLWSAHGDGVCCNWSNLTHITAPAKDEESNAFPYISTELTGSHYDAVRSVAVMPETGKVFTASRDGQLREYIPHFL